MPPSVAETEALFSIDDSLAASLHGAGSIPRKIASVRHSSTVRTAGPRRQTSAPSAVEHAENKGMIIIDSLLTAPLRGLMFVFEKINEAVHEEAEAEERAIMADLSALHRALDSKAIAEAEFDARERKLLDRLDHLHSHGSSDADDA